MTARLQELLRQKALLAEHAAWLDREIALEQMRSGGEVPPAASGGSPAPSAHAPQPAGAEADTILEQYGGSPATVHDRVKRGCILYLVAALLLTAISVVAIHYLSHRP